MRTHRSYSSAETQAMAAQAAREILAEKNSNKTDVSKTAKVIALHGDLGAGKTTFTQGFLKALGAKGRMTSPTFVLMKRFALPPSTQKLGYKHAYHIDAYRFRAPSEASALGLKEIFQDPNAIVIVEWPERLKGVLPKKTVVIRFRHGKNEDERVIIAP